MLVLLLVYCGVTAALLIGVGFVAEMRELHEKHPPGARPMWK
jgi:hypothetical protein